MVIINEIKMKAKLNQAAAENRGNETRVAYRRSGETRGKA